MSRRTHRRSLEWTVLCVCRCPCRCATVAVAGSSANGVASTRHCRPSTIFQPRSPSRPCSTRRDWPTVGNWCCSSTFRSCSPSTVCRNSSRSSSRSTSMCSTAGAAETAKRMAEHQSARLRLRPRPRWAAATAPTETACRPRRPRRPHCACSTLATCARVRSRRATPTRPAARRTETSENSNRQIRRCWMRFWLRRRAEPLRPPSSSICRS